MSRSRHTEAEMIGALKQVAGLKIESVSREVGVSKHTNEVGVEPRRVQKESGRAVGWWLPSIACIDYNGVRHKRPGIEEQTT